MSYSVLLTGATGFVGAAVLGRLLDDGCRVTAVVRGDYASVDSRAVRYGIDTLDEQTEWRNALEGVQVVVHLAARVHVMNDLEADPLSAFRRVNVEGTLKLARAAAASGVRRFIFLSSIKVNGEGTGPGRPYRADDVPAPVDPYGVSKMEAEQGLRALAEQIGMEVVIIRPVLVYGPGVKANFRAMMGWLQKGVPLPFGAIDNLRSLVALDNLVDLIATCQAHPAAANQTFLVSDDEDLSTTALLTRMARALGKTARLLPLPTRVLEMVAVIFGRRALSQRLCGSLQVDIQKTRSLLQWAPPVTVDDALMRTAQDFQEKTKA